LLPGLFGHDPWKFEEAVNFGVIQEIAVHGHWLSPQLAGEPYTLRPPFFFWLGAAFVRVMAGILQPHDAARLASALCMVVTLFAVAKAVDVLYGRKHARLAVLLLIGSMGLVIRAHEVNPDLGLLAGYAIVLWGIAQARATERDGEYAAFGIQPEVHGGVLRAGLLTGIGISLAYLCRGSLAFGMTLPLLAWVAWRRRQQRITWIPLLGLGLGLPALLIGMWFWAASGLPNGGGSADPRWFFAWWGREGSRILDPLRWIDRDADPGFYLSLLTWYGWPVAPLSLYAVWNAWRGRLGGQSVTLPVLAFVCGILAVGLGTAPREASALPLLLSLTLIATIGVDYMERSAANFMDWFGTMTFGLFCSVLWMGWIAQMTGQPERVRAYLEHHLPGYQEKFQWGAFVFALMVSLLWVFVVAKSRQNARRAVLNWAVGMTTLWLLLMTLWLPYIEMSRSYRKPFTALAVHLSSEEGCVQSRGLGLPQRALLEYYAGIHSERSELGLGSACPLLLVQSSQNFRPRGPEGGVLLWEGTRPGDRDEWYQLWRK
jgi:4-amino-4-deoxy-L-arabinose transferase-like glycosyltransferase